MNLRNVFLVLFELSIYSRNLNVLALEGEGIVGGTESLDGTHRYQVSLQENGKHFCGGGALGPVFVVTAAHCLISAETTQIRRRKIEVVGGVNNLHSSSNRQTRTVSQIHVPKEFFDFAYTLRTGDIAILKLNRAMNLIPKSYLVYPYLALPLAPREFKGRTAVVTGFGTIEVKVIRNLDTDEIFEEDENDGKLRFAEVRVLTDEEFFQKYGTRLTESRFGAKIITANTDEDKGICYGDSGSPLIMNNNILIGVISYGDKDCNENRHPTIYTNVVSFLPFIKAVIHGKFHSGVTLIWDDSKKIWNQLYL